MIFTSVFIKAYPEVVYLSILLICFFLVVCFVLDLFCLPQDTKLCIASATIIAWLVI